MDNYRNDTWKGIVGFILIASLISCGGNNNSTSSVVPIQQPPPPPEPIPAPVNNVVQIDFSFNNGTDSWLAGFSDYGVGSDGLQLSSGYEQLPIPLDNLSGFSVSGTNRVDDLYMFIKRAFIGFSVNSRYQIQFEITFASNASGASDCLGVGGAPGIAVTIKAGVVNIEPLSVLDDVNKYNMNIDKGIQKNSGLDALNIGNFGNTRPCADTTYEEKTLRSDPNTLLEVTPDSDGVLWFLFSTDSGFESTTHIYYLRGKITATKI